MIISSDYARDTKHTSELISQDHCLEAGHTDRCPSSRYFPELFLWYVFQCLANAYLDFTNGPWRSLKMEDFGQQRPGQYLLHNDIKTENVFLAATLAKPTDTVHYPIAKIGDYGLAITTNPDDIQRNHAKALQRGTPVWQPPVSPC
jgi:serine/threonine protein kinase